APRLGKPQKKHHQTNPQEKTDLQNYKQKTHKNRLYPTTQQKKKNFSGVIKHPPQTQKPRPNLIFGLKPRPRKQ
ncbi:hypothetical protein ACQWKP_23115, partial [Salmonella enterica subsp. enterica serovar Infantis]